MDAVEFFNEKSRLTKGCTIDCVKCKLSSYNNGFELSCSDFECKYPEKAIETLEQWSEENPPVTNLDKFKEVKDNILKTFNLSEYDFECDFECDCYGTKLPCILCKIFHNCDEYEEFWDSEYKGDEK